MEDKEHQKSDNPTESRSKRRKKRGKRNEIFGAARFSKLKPLKPSSSVDPLHESTNPELKELYYMKEMSIEDQMKLLLRDITKQPNETDTDAILKTIVNADVCFMENLLTSTIYSTGISEVDKLFRSEGFASGDIIEICGQTSSGKTLFLLTFLINNLMEKENFEAVYFDTKGDFIQSDFEKMVQANTTSIEVQKSIIKRIKVYKIENMTELLSKLNDYSQPQPFDEQKTTELRFLVIDTITEPFYHISSHRDYTFKLTSRIHSLLYRLAKERNLLVLVSNLALHRYKISESDDGETFSQQDNSQIYETDDLKPALSNYWREILTHRLLVSFVELPCTDILGFVEVSRKITVMECFDEEVSKNFALVKMVETGFVSQNK